MINIDSRLFGKVDANEFMLLAYLASMANSENFCFPGNRRICDDLGWSKVRMQATKKRLEEKGLIKIEARYRDNNPAQTSNIYRINTPQASNYTPVSKLGTGGVSHLGTGDTSKLGTGGVSNQGMAPVSKLGNEVLTIEALDNEVLVSEELTNEQQRKEHFERRFEENRVYHFYTLINKLFYQVNEAAEDSLSKATLKKIHDVAREIFQYFKNNPKPEMPEHLNRHSWDPGNEFNAAKYSECQIEAYYDYTRLTGEKYRVKIDKLAQTIVLTDWCERLLTYAKERFHHEYDPVDDDPQSYWLKEYFYYEIIAWQDRSNEKRVIY